MDDIAALRPTLFCGVPRVFDRIYAGVMSKVGWGGWQVPRRGGGAGAGPGCRWLGDAAELLGAPARQGQPRAACRPAAPLSAPCASSHQVAEGSPIKRMLFNWGYARKLHALEAGHAFDKVGARVGG